MSEPRRTYREPVFYFNPTGNCFLDAESISHKSILLSPNSMIPEKSGKIEFSFPNSEKIVSCGFNLVQSENNQFALELKSLKKEDKIILNDFISERNHLSKANIDGDSEATL